ncbi:MAG: DUF2442 domain-containing protein [Muribaculum sp.]|nr:DUF2442 domain-containing protein [Muribaculum sp.]
MDKIQEVWFEEDRIYMQTNTGNTYSRPLEAFPSLKDACLSDRQRFYIWGDGQYVRWKELDEDISIELFKDTKEPNRDNAIAKIFEKCPWLSVSEVAKFIGIPKHVLDRFIYGIWQPKEEVLKMIKNGIKEMSSAQILAVG